MTVSTAPASLAARRGRAIGAFARASVDRVAKAARRGGASALGAAGLVLIAVGAGMVYRPAGLIVGGALMVWFASLLPEGGRK